MVEHSSGVIAEGVHRITYRVYYEDTDAQGIVYHGNYLKYGERARTEILRLLGHEQHQLRSETGVVFVARRVEVEYYKPARLDDLMVVETFLQGMGRTSMTMRHDVRCNEALIASVLVVLVTVSDKMKPVAIPAAIAEVLRTSFNCPE